MARFYKYWIDGKGFYSSELAAQFVGMSRQLTKRCFTELGNKLTRVQMEKYRGRLAPHPTPKVTYNGKRMTIEAVAKAEGLTRGQVFCWWKRHGMPSTLYPENFDRIRLRENNGDTPYTLLPEGTRHSGRELAEMFGLSHSAISTRRIRTGQTAFSREELESMAARYKPKKKPPMGTTSKCCKPKSIHDVEYHPSAMERSIMGLR